MIFSTEKPDIASSKGEPDSRINDGSKIQIQDICSLCFKILNSLLIYSYQNRIMASIYKDNKWDNFS